MARQHGAEVGLGAQVAGGVGRGQQLDVDLRQRAAAGHVGGGQAQLVGAGLVAGRVQAGQHTVQRAGALRHQRPLRRASAGDFEPPGLEVAVGHAAADGRGGADRAVLQGQRQRHHRRGGIERVTHLQQLGGGRAQAVQVGGGGHQLDQAAGRRREQRTAAFVQRQRRAIERECSGRHRREGIGQHGDGHRLPRHRREAGRERNRHRRAHGQLCGAQGQAALDGGLAVAEADDHQVVAGLARARCPGEVAGDRIQRGAFGQATGGKAQRLVAVGVGADDRETQGFAQRGLVVGEHRHGRAVDIGHRHLHRQGVFQATRVGGREAQRVVAGLVKTGRPLEQAAGLVEKRAGRQRAHRGVDDRVAVGVGAHQGELQQPVFLAADTRDAGEQGRAVGLGNGDREGVAAAGRAIRRGDRDAAVATGVEVAGGPGQAPGHRVEPGAGRQVGGAVDQGIAVGIAGGQVDRQGGALGHRLVAHRQQQRCGVAGAHPQRDRALVGVAGRIGDREGDGVQAQIARTGCPQEDRAAVQHARCQCGAGGQAGGAEAQGVLVQIAGAQGELQGAADHRHLVADGHQQRRLAERLGRDHEGARGAEHAVRALAVAVVRGQQGDDVVAAVAVARRQAQHTNAVAGLDESGKARQAVKAQRQRVAVGVKHRDRHIEHLALAHRLGADGRHHGWPVGIAHDDGYAQRGRQRHTGAVALIGGLDLGHIRADLVEAGRPREQGRLGVEGGARGQGGRFVSDGGSCGFQRDQGAVAQAV